MPSDPEVEERALEERGSVLDRRLDRLIKIVVFLLVVVSLAFGAYYYYFQYSQGKMSTKERLIDQAKTFVRQNPRNAEARVRLGVLYAEQGKYDEAIAQYNQALKLVYDNQGGLVFRGVAYMNKGDNKAALESFKKEIKYYKNTAQAKSNDYLEQAYYYSGLIFWKNKDHDQAIEYLKSALEIRKTSADTHSWLGKVYLDKGLIDEAIKSFNEALKYDPRYADAHLGLGQAYEKKNDKEKAIAAYKEVLKISPDSNMAREALDRLTGGGKK